MLLLSFKQKNPCDGRIDAAEDGIEIINKMSKSRGTFQKDTHSPESRVLAQGSIETGSNGQLEPSGAGGGEKLVGLLKEEGIEGGKPNVDVGTLSGQSFGDRDLGLGLVRIFTYEEELHLCAVWYFRSLAMRGLSLS